MVPQNLQNPSVRPRKGSENLCPMRRLPMRKAKGFSIKRTRGSKEPREDPQNTSKPVENAHTFLPNAVPDFLDGFISNQALTKRRCI
jgi:hypothetical protein